MTTHRLTEFTIRYFPEYVVLDGAADAVRREAEPFLRRFVSSAKPFAVGENEQYQIVL